MCNHAPRTCVEALSPHDALGGQRDVGVLAEDDGRLAAQLERARRQVLGGGAGNNLAHHVRTGEEDEIELGRAQIRKGKVEDTNT